VPQEECVEQATCVLQRCRQRQMPSHKSNTRDCAINWQVHRQRTSPPCSESTCASCQPPAAAH
jgi:hypothetical protein